MEIPCRIIFKGDRHNGEALVGRAKQVMLVLEEMMRLRGLQQYSVNVSPYPGALITCSKVFGLRQTVISVSGSRGGEQEERKECFCNCNFTLGWILELQTEKVEGDAQMYTVMACKDKRGYSVVENVLASDFTEYTVGHPVILIPYNAMAFLCCTEETVVPTGCKFVESKESLSSDAWRSALRIVPWCATRAPRWIPVR